MFLILCILIFLFISFKNYIFYQRIWFTTLLSVFFQVSWFTMLIVFTLLIEFLYSFYTYYSILTYLHQLLLSFFTLLNRISKIIIKWCCRISWAGLLSMSRAEDYPASRPVAPPPWRDGAPLEGISPDAGTRRAARSGRAAAAAPPLSAVFAIHQI